LVVSLTFKSTISTTLLSFLTLLAGAIITIAIIIIIIIVTYERDERAAVIVVLMDMCGIQLVVSLTFKSTATLLSFLARLAGTIVIVIVIIVITCERDERSAVTIVLLDMCGMQLVVSLTFESTTSLLSFLTLLADALVIIVIVITCERDERATVNFALMEKRCSMSCFTYLQEHDQYHPSFLSYSSCWCHHHHHHHHRHRHRHRHRLRERRTSIC
jgi:hypothetical protein